MNTCPCFDWAYSNTAPCVADKPFHPPTVEESNQGKEEDGEEVKGEEGEEAKGEEGEYDDVDTNRSAVPPYLKHERYVAIRLSEGEGGRVDSL